MKELWIDLRGDASDRIMTGLPPEIPMTGIITDGETTRDVPRVQHLRIATYHATATALAGAPGDLIVSSDTAVLREARRLGHATALWATVDDAAGLQRVASDGRAQAAVFVAFSDETNIPLELLLATFQHTDTKVLKAVRGLDEAKLALGTLEAGCDGVVVPGTATELLSDLETWRRACVWTAIEMEPVTVAEVASAEMGARVCVDTVEMLGADEGMLVGSTAAGGLCVCAEVHPLPYMKLRPFRVNAGALHSYVACPEGRTAYLSELVAGDRVLVASTGGRARPVTVGRAKMEYRPLLRITAAHRDERLSVMLQNDWHVRIFDADGHARSITTLRPGDRVLASMLRAPRHVGLAVSERLWER